MKSARAPFRRDASRTVAGIWSVSDGRAALEPFAPLTRSTRSRRDSAEPRGDVAIRQAGRVQLLVPYRQHGDAHDVPQLDAGVGRDVDPLDLKRPVEADATERAMGVVAEVAASALI